jgi:hypothetical protein
MFALHSDLIALRAKHCPKYRQMLSLYSELMRITRKPIILGEDMEEALGELRDKKVVIELLDECRNKKSLLEAEGCAEARVIMKRLINAGEDMQILVMALGRKRDEMEVNERLRRLRLQPA